MQAVEVVLDLGLRWCTESARQAKSISACSCCTANVRTLCPVVFFRDCYDARRIPPPAVTLPVVSPRCRMPLLRIYLLGAPIPTSSERTTRAPVHDIAR